MSDLSVGLYEVFLTSALAGALELQKLLDVADVAELQNAEAADRVALHLARVVERAIDTAPEKERAKIGVKIARRLLDQLSTDLADPEFESERPQESGKILRAVLGRLPDGSKRRIPAPKIPLLDTTLLTNAPGEPRIGHQIQTEIASADRIDVVMAFIRRSGIHPLIESLRRHVADGKSLRILTTVYTGSTEGEALVDLERIGAQVRVSYDTTGTRLHAKAWLFHRNTGYSTAYVGSSNLTHSAQQSGLEWNVRVSEARNRSVVEKIAAVFESYWAQTDFEPFNIERFRDSLKQSSGSLPLVLLAPIEIRLEPFQERLLEQIELARQQGHHRNLLVSATGTGKTVMAAVDFARLRKVMPHARLLFIAHREEILSQSRATFAHAVRDAGFGEMWVGGHKPTEFEHVFASIQSLTASKLQYIDPEHFDVVIVDEFHHAAAESYERVLNHLRPKELLGLTATPERSDDLSVLKWFEGRIAAELRLWDAIDQHRLVPFSYFGIADELDLRAVPWRRGAGYDVGGLTNIITATDFWARSVLQQFQQKICRWEQARALGFCVSITHARYMARVFSENGVRAVAIWSDTPDAERKAAISDLAAGRVNVVFSVDLFNEGVDVPAVDTLLMLRPTDSPLLFLQQLGRGLRKSPGKNVCTVLDFVGHHRREFSYHRRFQALLGGSRETVARQVEEGFPFLPAGCDMQLEPQAAQRVLENIRNSVPSTWPKRARELRELVAEAGDQPISLGRFIELSGLELTDIYDAGRSWSDMKAEAGLPLLPAGPSERELRRAVGRLLHVDDPERLSRWRGWLGVEAKPPVTALALRERRLLRMLLAQLFQSIATKDDTLAYGVDELWKHPAVRAEIVELLDVLGARVNHVSIALEKPGAVPLTVHARYTRVEMVAASRNDDLLTVPVFQGGFIFEPTIKADICAFTLDKTSGNFSPTTRYRDYAISRELIHWESQSVTREASGTGQRYQHHEVQGSFIMLFARHTTDDRAFYFLGPATYVSHTGEQPMQITWRLRHPLPGDLFQSFAAAVA